MVAGKSASSSLDVSYDDSTPMGSPGSAASSGMKRKRTTKACDTCNRRKVKCDSAQPSCHQCASHDLQCTYSREAKKRGPKQGHIRDLESRLQKMEGYLGSTGVDPETVIENEDDEQAHTRDSKHHLIHLQNSQQPLLKADKTAGTATPPKQRRRKNKEVAVLPPPPSTGHQDPPIPPFLNQPPPPAPTQTFQPFAQRIQPPFQSLHLFTPQAASASSGSTTGGGPDDVWTMIDRDFDSLMGGGTPQPGLAAAGGIPEGRESESDGGKGGSGVQGGMMSLSDITNPFGIMFDALDAVAVLGAEGVGVESQPTIVPPSTSAATSMWDVPPDALDELLDLFFIYANPILGHCIHERMFRENLARQTPLVLASMYALAARFSRHPAVLAAARAAATSLGGGEEVDMYNAGDVFYSQARVLVSKAMDVPSTDTVYALIMLVTYASGSGRAAASWMYSGMAIRMAQSLKLDLDPDFPEVTDLFGPLTWYEKELRRRLWWCCFIMDRYTASAADRSMLVLERDARVFCPVPQRVWFSMGAADPEPGPGEPGGHSTLDLTILASAGVAGESRREDRDGRERKRGGGGNVFRDNAFDYYIALSRIYGRVVEYTGMLKIPSPGIPGSVLVSLPGPEQKRKAIESDLKDWLESLPLWMADPPSVPLSSAIPFMPHLRSSRHSSLLAHLHDSSAPFLSPDPEPLMYLRSCSVEGDDSEASPAPTGKRVRFAANWSNLDSVSGGLSPASWEVAYLHIFHCAAVVLLNRPLMMAYLQGQGQGSTSYDSAGCGAAGDGHEPNSQTPVDAMSCPNFVASLEAARRASDLLEEVMETNPNFFWFTPFVAFCIFQTSLVHVIAAQTLGKTEPGGDAEVTDACRRVRVHLRALRNFSRFWLQGARLSLLLQDLFLTVERAVLGGGGVEV
ncbi:hypothetical protein HDU67_003087 [Dinochytrium kinnereticum]|nr:hypothetical protein HDU67_003087 [Dinochytrium kinnereticum]